LAASFIGLLRSFRGAHHRGGGAGLQERRTLLGQSVH
jgi:hypothetical protein